MPLNVVWMKDSYPPATNNTTTLVCHLCLISSVAFVPHFNFITLNNVGGTWYYTRDVRPNQGAGSYEKLITNTSKEMSCFSDFPMPEDFPQVWLVLAETYLKRGYDSVR